MGPDHAGRIRRQLHGLDRQRRRTAPCNGTQAVQHRLQIALDLGILSLAVNFAGGRHRLRLNGLPVLRAYLLAGVGIQCFDQVGQQDRPADIQRQNVLPVQNRCERCLTVRPVAGHQMDAHHAGAVRVKRDMPHPVQMTMQESVLPVGQMFCISHKKRFPSSIVI